MRREMKEARALGVKEAHSGREQHRDQEAEALGNVVATVLKDELGEREGGACSQFL